MKIITSLPEDILRNTRTFQIRDQGCLEKMLWNVTHTYTHTHRNMSRFTHSIQWGLMQPARTLFSLWPDWCEHGKPSSPACSYVLYLFPLSSARCLNYAAWGSPRSRSCEMTRVRIHVNTFEFQASVYKAYRTASEIKLDCDLHVQHFNQLQSRIFHSGLHFVKAWMWLQSCQQKINTTPPVTDLLNI